jgi:FkbM family methyltransferase
MSAGTVQKPPVTRAKLVYRLFRGLVRTLTVPARRLPEGRLKNAVRSLMLNFQHSLPTELVVNRGDTVVQVGTPTPKTVRRFQRAVGPQGRLVIVEAMPENQRRLREDIERRGLSNVQVIEAAACNENGSGELAVSPLWGDHKLPLDGVTIDNDERPENHAMQRIPVRLVRLDDALGDLGLTSVDFLSVTVNGAEAEVLRGAAQILSSSRPGTRVYAKGHALDAAGQPIHQQTEPLMRSFGFRTKVSRGEPSTTQARRAGDLFAWKA